MLRLALCILMVTCLILATQASIPEFKGLESASLIGGSRAKVDEIRYYVSLQISGEHFCGGGIIGNRYVLSAAHCFMSELNEFYTESVTVVAGSNDLNNHTLPGEVRVEVEKIYVPGNYTDSKWAIFPPFGDIAVLKLKESLNLEKNKHLRKLRLPRQRKSVTGFGYQTYDNKRALISGFGWDNVTIRRWKDSKHEFERGSSSGQLMKAKVRIISNDECQNRYPHPILYYELCAQVIEHKGSKTPQGVCRGDSGSPLVYRQKKIIGVLNGISLGCNENKQPGLYSRVSTYMGFIKDAFDDVTDDMQVKVFD